MCWLSIRPGTVIYRWMLKFGKTCTASCWPPPPSSGGPCCGWCGWVDFAEMRYYDTMQAWKPLLFAVGLALLCAVLERALRRRAGADASLLWIPERLRPMLHRSGGFLRRTRRLWLVWLAWAVLLAGLWFLADGQLDRVLAPWIARYGEELVQSGFPESWTILRGRLEADVALWLRLRQGVLIAGAVSGAGVLVWTLLHWKKRRPPLAEEGET